VIHDALIDSPSPDTALLRKAYSEFRAADERFDTISFSAVHEHEVRHFHEFLGSPYGQSIMFDQTLLVSCLAALWSELREEEVLVVPLQKWAELNDTYYSVIERKVQPARLRRHPPPMTSALVLKTSKVLERLRSINRPCRQMDTIAKGFAPTFMQLMESTALSVQLSRLKDIYADEALLEGYLRKLGEKDKNQRYLQTWNLWYTLERQLKLKRAGKLSKPAVPHTIRNAVTFFCLCATANDDASARDATAPGRDKFHPGSIFFKLWCELRSEKRIPVDSAIVGWLDGKAKKLGLMTLRESLESSIELSESRLKLLRQDFDGKKTPAFEGLVARTNDFGTSSDCGCWHDEA
jgi:hypothetical protein